MSCRRVSSTTGRFPDEPESGRRVSQTSKHFLAVSQEVCSRDLHLRIPLQAPFWQAAILETGHVVIEVPERDEGGRDTWQEKEASVTLEIRQSMSELSQAISFIQPYWFWPQEAGVKKPGFPAVWLIPDPDYPLVNL